MMLLGYVILIISGNQATPLTEHIYPTETTANSYIAWELYGKANLCYFFVKTS